MSDLFQDVRYSVRSLLKQRAFTVSVVLTLGLGIGLITAVFSVTDAVLFRPLPFFEPDRLVELWERDPKQPIYQFAPGRNTVEFWRGQTRVFSRVEAYSWATFVVTGAGEPESLRAALASPGLFSALGVSPVLGRGLTDTDALTGSPQVMVISHTFWRTRFASAADAIGKTLMLNGQPHEVIGVMPERFAFPVATTLFWVPLSTTESGRVNAIARLPEDTSILAAQAAADTLTPVLASTDPKGPHSLRLIPLGEHRANKRPRQALLALLGAVGFVLLLTCANVANLLLARGAERQAEIAIRMAVGASRERLIRGLLTESLVLAAAGGLVGLGLAWVGVKVLAGMVPTEFTFLSVATIDMDPRVVAFTVAVAGSKGTAGVAPIRWLRLGYQGSIAIHRAIARAPVATARSEADHRSST